MGHDYESGKGREGIDEEHFSGHGNIPHGITWESEGDFDWITCFADKMWNNVACKKL